LFFSPFGGLTKSLIAIAFCFLVDAILDVASNFSSERLIIQPQSTGIYRILSSLESNIIKNSCELGHLVGPWKRGNYFNLTRRFDWFCGLYANAITDERQRAMRRFALYLIIAITIYRCT
jgi:hypothetical protein